MQNTARAFFRSLKRKSVGLANNGAGIWQGELAGKLMDDIIVVQKFITAFAAY